MKKTRYIFLIIGIIIITCSLVQISASNELSTKGIELSAIQNQISSLHKQDALMKEQIYNLSSFSNLASAAATMGFVPEKSPIFVDTSLPVAFKQ